MTPEPDSRGKRAKEFTSWPVRELFGCPQMFILQSKCFVCLVCLWWAHLQDRQEQEGVDVLQQRQHCVLCFDHVRPVHLLTAAGEGTLGPDRAFPLPPVSVKPLFITTRGKERRTVWVFAFLWSYLNITDKSWMEMDGEEDGGAMTTVILTWHKRISNVIAWAREKEKRTIWMLLTTGKLHSIWQ